MLNILETIHTFGTSTVECMGLRLLSDVDVNDGEKTVDLTLAPCRNRAEKSPPSNPQSKKA